MRLRLSSVAAVLLATLGAAFVCLLTWGATVAAAGLAVVRRGPVTAAPMSGGETIVLALVLVAVLAVAVYAVVRSGRGASTPRVKQLDDARESRRKRAAHSDREQRPKAA